MTDTVKKVAEAMEAKRAELIAKPLARIWPDLARAAISAMQGWRPIEEAPKNRTAIWAAFRSDIYPTVEPLRPDLERWNGVQVPLRHPGLAEDGFDIGWNVAAPVGHGGFPDDWIAGFMLLPSPPEGE